MTASKKDLQTSATPDISKLEALTSLQQAYHVPNYAPSLALVKGRGSYVWDAGGTKYLDFVSGIAVTTLGHCHPAVTKALTRQAKTLLHVSNLYYNDQAPHLAKDLSELSLGGKVFFCNSGAEANEALIKLARLWGSQEGRYRVVTMRNSFHGRTLATLTATGQDKIQKGFAPLPDGFDYADYNDLESVKAQLTPQTVAVMLEMVQAEGGVVPVDPAFAQALAELCKERNLLLLVDEIQTGMGRTGSWFAYQQYGIEPDAISLAKGLGGGVPIGAIVTGERLKDVFTPGTHGSTFGGQPLACAAARAVVNTMRAKDLPAHANAMGQLFRTRLEKLINQYGFVRSVRGQGLLVGLVIDRPAKELEQLIARAGLLCVCTAGSVIRLLPPLNVTAAQVKKAVRMIDKACAQWQECLSQNEEKATP